MPSAHQILNTSDIPSKALYSCVNDKLVALSLPFDMILNTWVWSTTHLCLYPF